MRGLSWLRAYSRVLSHTSHTTHFQLLSGTEVFRLDAPGATTCASGVLAEVDEHRRTGASSFFAASPPYRKASGSDCDLKAIITPAGLQLRLLVPATRFEARCMYLPPGKWTLLQHQDCSEGQDEHFCEYYKCSVAALARTGPSHLGIIAHTHPAILKMQNHPPPPSVAIAI